MAARVASWLTRPALLRTLVLHARLAVRLLREPRVPLLLKGLLALPVLYLISPVDFLPDVIPLAGQIDDLGVLLLGLEAFLRWCPQDVVSFHRAALDARRPYAPVPDTGVVIDAEWRRG